MIVALGAFLGFTIGYFIGALMSSASQTSRYIEGFKDGMQKNIITKEIMKI